MTDIGPLLVVLGTPRSGTSLTAGLLAAHGVWTGECRPADKWNPKGYFENRPLAALRKRPPIYPEDLEPLDVPSTPWLVKHTPNYWKSWLPYDPVFVLVRREPEASAESCIRMNAYPDQSYEVRVRTALVDNAVMNQIAKQAPSINVFSDRMVRDGEFTGVEEALNEVGFSFDRGVAEGFLDGSLWHS